MKIFGRLAAPAKGKPPVAVTARSGMRAMRAIGGISISVESRNRKRLGASIAASVSQLASAGVGHMRLDLDAVEAGAQEAQRQRQRIVLEDFAADFEQRQADGVAPVDVHDDLRAATSRPGA